MLSRSDILMINLEKKENITKISSIELLAKVDLFTGSLKYLIWRNNIFII